jgi:pyrimidine-nucleoside phosphorylase
LSSGRALEIFTRLIERQGGNPHIVDNYSLLPSAPDCEPVRATRSGYVTTMRAESVGRATHALGAGRSRVGESIDYGVGIVAKAGLGDKVSAGDTLFELHHRAGHGVDTAQALCAGAIVIDDEPPVSRPLVLELIH